MITVTTPADDFRLVTPEAAREALSITNQGEDDALSRLIERASDVIARECNRVFARETVREQFRPDCRSDDLLLSRWPVVAIVTVTENGTQLDTSEFEINQRTGVLTRLRGDRPSPWPLRGKIVVEYSAGFELPNGAPETLQQACTQLVKSYYVGSDRDPMMRSEAVEQLSSASYFDAPLPPDVVGLIEKFRNAR